MQTLIAVLFFATGAVDNNGPFDVEVEDFVDGSGQLLGPLYAGDDEPVYFGDSQDCWLEWDTAATPDAMQLVCTDIDGAGTDGVVCYVDTGTRVWHCLGGLTIDGTLSGVSGIDATTESTIEAAIDTLANLTSVQSQAVSLAGSVTVEAGGLVANQDLTTDASPTFAGATFNGTVNHSGYDITNSDDLYSANTTTDAAPEPKVIATPAPYQLPSTVPNTNRNGANLVFAPGQGLQVVGEIVPATVAGKTITLTATLQGTAAAGVTKTEGVASPDGFACATLTAAQCALNIYTLLTGAGAVSGCTVTCIDGTCSNGQFAVGATPGTSERCVFTTNDSTAFPLSAPDQGVDGSVVTGAAITGRSFTATAATGFTVSVGGVVGGDGSSPLAFSPLGANYRVGVDYSGLHFRSTPMNLTASTMTGTAIQTGAKLNTTQTKLTWTNAMVAALGASATGDIGVATLPAKTHIRNVYLVINTACTAAGTLTVSVGRTGADYIDYIVASDAKAAANTLYGGTAGERGTNLTGYDVPSYTGTTTIYAHFVSGTGNLDAVTTCTGSIILETEALL